MPSDGSSIVGKIRAFYAAVQQDNKVIDLVPMANDIMLMVRKPATQRHLHEDKVAMVFLRFARLLLQSNASIMRLFGLRILREWVDDRWAIQRLIETRLDFLVGLCLEQTKSLTSSSGTTAAEAVHERAEAIKLVNQIVCVDPEHFDSKALLTSLIAVARDVDSNASGSGSGSSSVKSSGSASSSPNAKPSHGCRLICLELLRRVVVNDLTLASNSSAIDALFEAALDPYCQSISKTIVLTLLYLLNEPKYRERIRVGLDIQKFLLPLTAIPLKTDSAWRARCEIAIGSICLITKTWVGIRLLAADSNGGFRALVDLLHCGHPVKNVQVRAILRLFAKILKQNLRCKSDGHSFFYSGFPNDNVLFAFDQFNPVNNYSALLLLGLVNAGLIQALARISMDASGELKECAVRLINQILDASCNLLPEQHFAKLLTLPDLVDATMTEALGRRIRASNTLIDVSPKQVAASAARSQMRQIVSKFITTQAFLGSSPQSFSSFGLGFGAAHHLSRTDSVGSGLGFGLGLGNSALGSDLDHGPSTADLLKASQVLRSDSYKNWDWSAIGALFQRLLDEDAVAFEEVYRTSFFSRLETFFAPGSGASEGPHAAGSTNDGGRTPSRGSFRVQKITDLNDLDTGINLGFGGIGWHCDEFQYAQSLRQFVQVLLLYPPRGLKIAHNIFNAICDGISMNVGVHENPYFSPKQCSQTMARTLVTLLAQILSNEGSDEFIATTHAVYTASSSFSKLYIIRVYMASCDLSSTNCRNLMELWMGQKHATSTLIHTFAVPFLLLAIKQAMVTGKEAIIVWSLNLLLDMIKLYSIEQDEIHLRQEQQRRQQSDRRRQTSSAPASRSRASNSSGGSMHVPPPLAAVARRRLSAAFAVDAPQASPRSPGSPFDDLGGEETDGNTYGYGPTSAESSSGAEQHGHGPLDEEKERALDWETVRDPESELAVDVPSKRRVAILATEALYAACQIEAVLNLLVNLKPDFRSLQSVPAPVGRDLVMLFLSTRDGLKYLQSQQTAAQKAAGVDCKDDNWVTYNFEDWFISEHLAYVLAVERQIAEAVLLSSQNSGAGGKLSGLGRDSMQAGADGRHGPASLSGVRCVSLADAHNHNGGADKQMGSGGMYGAAAAAAAMAALPGSHLMQLDLQWIFQFPWRVKLCYNVPGNEKLVPILVDTYVDMAQHDVSRPGVFTVRARVVQEDNVPTRLWIPPNATLRAHLALGNYLVFCDGQLEDDIEFDLTASGGGLERGMTRSMSRLPSRPPEWSYCYFEDILNAAFHQRRRSREAGTRRQRASRARKNRDGRCQTEVPRVDAHDCRVSIPSYSCKFNFVEEHPERRSSVAAFEALSAQDELSDSDDSEGLPPMAGPGTADVRDTPLRQDDHEDNFAADGEGEECDDDNLEQEEADSPGTDDSPQARRRRTRRRIRMRKKARAQEDAEKKAAEEKAMLEAAMKAEAEQVAAAEAALAAAGYSNLGDSEADGFISDTTSSSEAPPPPEENLLRLESVDFELSLLPDPDCRIAATPRHMFGELAKTFTGVSLLQQSGFLEILCHCAFSPDFLAKDRDSYSAGRELLQRRGALFALAHVCSCDIGYELVQSIDPDILGRFVDLLHTSDISSICGTCFMCLGIMSGAPSARLDLAKLGWGSPSRPRSKLSVPAKFDQVFRGTTLVEDRGGGVVGIRLNKHAETKRNADAKKGAAGSDIEEGESELEVDSDDGGSDSDGTPSRARDESETEAARVVGGGYSNGDLESFLAAARSATEKEIIGCLGDVTCTLTRLKARKRLAELKRADTLVASEPVLHVLEYLLVHREMPLKDRQFLVFQMFPSLIRAVDAPGAP